MNTYQFKTNINCSGCVAKVSPHLDSENKIKDWKVNTEDPGKILTVQTESLNENEVRSIVEKAGFKEEKL